MIPKHLITTWICDPARDRYTDAHRALFQRCLASWLRLMPDYALTIVTLGNLFDLGRDPWVEACVADGNFIGASQWARLTWLLRVGGIYLDMDVEAVKRFDGLLSEGCVVGHIGAGKPYANNAVMMATPDHPFIRAQLDALPTCDASSPQFGNESGPYLISRLLEAQGWTGRDEDARVGDVRVLPSRAFHPYPWWEPFTPACITPDTLAVHHWGQSWHPRAGLTHQGPTRVRLLAGTPIGGHGAHRHGWPYVVGALRETLAGDGGVLFDDFVEQSYFWPDSRDRRRPRQKPWIGVFHLPAGTPTYFRAEQNLERLWDHPRFVADRTHLVGAIALSTTLADWLRRALPHVPVAALRYPTETAVPTFDLTQYEAAPTLAQVGWYLRNQEAIHQAPVPAGVRKLHVRRGHAWELAAAERMRQIGPFAARPVVGETEVVGALSPAEYDALLTRAVLLAEFFGASASTTIMEALARNTPILVPRLPAIEEYLGPDYPGYFVSLENVPALLAPESVRRIAAYLEGLDRAPLDVTRFVRGVARLVSLATGDAKAEAPTAQMTAIDLRFLAALVADARHVVEIGCWEGGTTRWLRDHMPPASTVYAVDPWQGENAARYPTFRTHTADYLHDGRIAEIRRPAAEAFSALFERPGPVVDVVFIDGDHRYHAVRDDIDRYRQIVRRGGVLCGHDYSRAFPGVRQAVDEAFPGVAVADAVWWVRL